jgi:hypothetical protein
VPLVSGGGAGLGRSARAAASGRSAGTGPAAGSGRAAGVGGAGGAAVALGDGAPEPPCRVIPPNAAPCSNPAPLETRRRARLGLGSSVWDAIVPNSEASSCGERTRFSLAGRLRSPAMGGS